ncbi:hypothetical protein JCM30204_27160 [Dysgonomonas termitidis]
MIDEQNTKLRNGTSFPNLSKKGSSQNHFVNSGALTQTLQNYIHKTAYAVKSFTEIKINMKKILGNR